jgi:hypothetical protein
MTRAAILITLYPLRAWLFFGPFTRDGSRGMRIGPLTFVIFDEENK